MPTYSIQCTNCGNTTTFVSKIADRNNTPKCCMCGGETKRLLDTPQIQAQTISGIIRCSDGTIHEGHTSFERHMEKNNLIPGSDATSEASRNRERLNKERTEEARKSVETIFNKLEQTNG